MAREKQLVRVFVELADTLVDEFDIIDFLNHLAEHAVELLRADAVGIVFADQRGELRVLASSNEEARLLELFEIQTAEGPCVDCFTSGRPVVNVDLGLARDRWPNFHAATTEAGYRAVHSLPLRLRSRVLGAMNLFCAERSELSEDDIAVGQALCDVASIGLLQERAVRERGLLAEQLQGALNSRVLLEQAKGALAARSGLDADDAFAQMRDYARRSRRPLRTVAAEVIEGVSDLLEDRQST